MRRGRSQRGLGATPLAAVGCLLMGFSVVSDPVFVAPELQVPAPPNLMLSAAARVAEVGLPTAELCLGEGACQQPREVWVDYGAAGIPGRYGGEWIRYDLDEVTRPLAAAALAQEGELSLAVRTALSEVGADRLVTNRYGLLEVVGILYTIDNRLDPSVYDPEQRPSAPIFPGCGVEGTLASCANADQYNGNGTWRALAPRKRYASALLNAAVDVAVTGWWLKKTGAVEDFTDGATNYVHRCGGTAYGWSTHHCDAQQGRPERDIAGAQPHTGPLVFRAPARWMGKRGYYALHETVRVDYDPWWSNPVGDGVLRPREGRFPQDEALGPGSAVAQLSVGQGASLDPDVLAVIAASWAP